MESITMTPKKSKVTPWSVRKQLFGSLKYVQKNSESNHNGVNTQAAETDEPAFQRKVLLINSVYHLNKDKFVKVGLDLNNNFQPTVEIGKNYTKIPYIYLTVFEWELLFQKNNVITEFFVAGEFDKSPFWITGDLYISFCTLYDQRCIRLTNRRDTPHGTIYFTQVVWKILKNLEPCISYRLENLHEKIPIADSTFSNIYKKVYSSFVNESNITKELIESKCKDIFYQQFYGAESGNLDNCESLCAAEIVFLASDKIFDNLMNEKENMLNLAPNFYNENACNSFQDTF